MREVIVNIDSKQTISELSNLLQPFKAEVYLRKASEGNVQEINLKSFLGLVSTRLENGERVYLLAEGEDKEKALDAVEEYLS
ncbi:HPr family phosphocarrier protein [Marinococcus luteus]|uniref:HPr family phosphocarrier protein n=1 Tax=Marinococcus luteus TaxID=1122204 RepID=UPI002ACCD226|nr:HPr family phosphocarrier protein [Marinococcus luteus]MDZ5783923.1 HPr family phosphocarrier protein [Marinococcus luteus]